MLSDKDYIIRSIRRYERRYKLAAIYGCIGVLAAMCTYLGYVEFSSSSDRLMDLMGAQPKEGSLVTDNIVKLMKASNEASYAIGVNTGLIFFGLSAACGMLIGKSIYFLIGARKERIIAKLYGQSKI